VAGFFLAASIMSPDLKLTYRIVLIMLLAAEMLAFTGIVRAPHALWLAELSIANLGTYALFMAVLYAFSRPPAGEAGKVAIGGAVLAALAVLIEYRWAPVRPAWEWVFVASAGFGAAALAALIIRLKRKTGDPALNHDLLAAAGIAPLADPTVSFYLYLTQALHPLAFDLGAYRFDALLGFQPSAVLALIAQQAPPLMVVLSTAYYFQPYGISMLYALQRVSPRRRPFSIVAFQAVSALLSALLLYHLYPVAGPAYAFGAAFPAHLPDASGLEATSSLVLRGARNGVPSMHFAWALALWLSARYLGVPWVRALFAAWLGLTVLSTLAMGEHYLIDLVVAVPLVIGVLALCALELPWKGARARAVWVGLGLTLAWILILRFGAGLFTAVPPLAWVAVLGTVVVTTMIYRPFERMALTEPTAAPAKRTAPVEAVAGSRRAFRLAGLMFLMSGFAALVYQVLFSKTLALAFGSQATATYTVLAVYMGGMALGAWLGGRLAARRSDPLKLYAWCELGIGAYCLATPLIFVGIRALYVEAAGGFPPDAAVLTIFRVALGAAALLVPTVLMGATLPILARYCETRTTSLGTSVAWLYGANTVGAAFGALLAGYAIMPALGIWKTTLVAAALNFMVAWLAFGWQSREKAPAGASATNAAAPPAVAVAPETGRLGGIALAVLAIGGAVTLALEVCYIHLLSVVAGNSVYAFALMLFAFLLGLGGGAETARRLLELRINLPLALAWLEFALAAVVLSGVFLWEGMPAYFASFESYPLTREFGAREVVRALVCLVAMLPPAFVIGAVYPLAMECVGRAHVRAPIAALGRAAALNTAGNIVGVLAAGFWLLPAIGALRSIQLAAGVSLAVGVLIVAAGGLLRRPLAWSPAVLVVALLAIQPRAFDYTALASGANVYFEKQSYGRVIDHAESVDGGLTTVTVVEGAGRATLRVLLTNGKFQGTNDLGGEGIAQAAFALTPLMHTGSRQSALVIGYGTGMSARVLHDAGFTDLEIVELSSDVVRLANEHFSSVNAGVTARPGVRTYITDGRNFLLLQDRRYDVVSMELSSIWFAGAASLYNREFYQLAKRRLAPAGVLQQWVQLHHIHPSDIVYILGSVRSEFRYVWVYEVGGQGIVVASNSPAAVPRREYLENLDRTAALGPLLKLQGGSATKLAQQRLLDPEGVDRLLGAFMLAPGHWVSTDDNLILEYSTPRGNVLDGTRSHLQNVQLLRSHATRGGFAGGGAP
jgi:predicted membrane-bound spermidine synthase